MWYVYNSVHYDNLLKIILTGAMLTKNNVLTSLKVANCTLGPKGLCEVCRAIAMNTTLTLLDLSMNKFDEQSVASLGKLPK